MPPAARSKKSGGEANTNDGEKKPSFWATLPGILTAAGTFIAACAGLVTALNTAGVIGTSKEPDKKAPQKNAGTNTVPIPVVRSAPVTPPSSNLQTDASAQSDTKSVSSVQSQTVSDSTTVTVSQPVPNNRIAEEKKSVILTLSEGEFKHLDFANTDVSAAFQNMNGERFITLRVMPTAEEGVAQAAFENSVVNFASAGNKYAVQVIGIDYANRKVTLKASCVSCP